LTGPPGTGYTGRVCAESFRQGIGTGSRSVCFRSQCASRHGCFLIEARVLAASSSEAISMASVEELEARAGEVRSLQKQAAKQLAELQRLAGGSSPALPATAWMRAVALRILALTGGDTAAALEYLRVKKRRADLTEVKSWYDVLTDGDREALLQPAEGNPAKARQHREADKFLEERQLVAWVKKQNEDKHVAPTPRAVIDRAVTHCQLPCRRKSRYTWLQRLVRRWGGRKVAFCPGEQLDREGLELKAPCRSDEVPRVCCTRAYCGPGSGAAERHSMWVLF